jgi:hypothetical protein
MRTNIILLHRAFQSRKWVVEILRHDQVRQLAKTGDDVESPRSTWRRDSLAQ